MLLSLLQIPTVIQCNGIVNLKYVIVLECDSFFVSLRVREHNIKRNKK